MLFFFFPLVGSNEACLGEGWGSNAQKKPSRSRRNPPLLEEDDVDAARLPKPGKNS